MWESRSQDRERWWTRTIHSVRELAHCRGRIGLDGDKHLDGRRLRTGAVTHGMQQDGPWRTGNTNDFIMTSRSTEARRVQVLDFDWFKTDHWAVLAVLSLKTKMRDTMKSDVNLRGWQPDDSWQRAAAETLTDWGNWDVMSPLLKETAKAHKRMETKEMTVTELEVKSRLLMKKREGRHLERAELNGLCRAIWRKRRALKREKHLIKSKENAETGKASKKTQNKHFNWSSICETRKPRNSSLKLLPKPLLDSCGPGRSHPIRETSLDGALGKT